MNDKDNLMRELLEKMIIDLRKQVEEKVPETGLFPAVYVSEDVSKMIRGLSRVILKVSNTGVKGSEDNRFLDFGAVHDSCPYGVECAVGYGTTRDILARLQEPELLDLMMSKIPKYVEDIEYEERHPYG